MSAPRFSIVTPVYRPPAWALREAIESVRAQTLGDWELCLVDDASGDAEVAAVLREAAAADPRVRVQVRDANGGIVAASNDGVAMARGEFVALLDHDDLLEPNALELVAEAIDAAGADEVDYLYTDEDKLDPEGRPYDPFYKPDWSPSRFRCQMYTSHLGVLRRSLVEELGGFRQAFEGSQDFDLVLRLTERARKVVHVPEVTYHWRALPSSTASSQDAKPTAFLAGERAIAEHLRRTAFPATVAMDAEHLGVYRLTPELPREPLVSIVIPTVGSRRVVYGDSIDLVVNAVRSIVDRSTYTNVEILIVADGPTPPATIASLRELGGDRLRIIPFDRPFNFSSKINVGAIHARGEFVLMLNDDIEVIAPDWIEHLLMYGLDPTVGAVGGKLRFSDGRYQHVGIVFPGGNPAHPFHGYPGSYVGPFYSNLVPADLLGVTGACLLVAREVFHEVGGLSPAFPLNFNDVDFCLKLAMTGRRSVFSPGAELYHYESSTRMPVVIAEEIGLLKDRWGQVMANDPYYSHHFQQETAHHLVKSVVTGYPARR